MSFQAHTLYNTVLLFSGWSSVLSFCRSQRDIACQIIYSLVFLLVLDVVTSDPPCSVPVGMYNGGDIEKGHE
jgi:hypothetical protein